MPTASAPWGHGCSPPRFALSGRVRWPLEKSTRIAVRLPQIVLLQFNLGNDQTCNSHICLWVFFWSPLLLQTTSAHFSLLLWEKGWEMDSGIVNSWPWHLLHRKWQLNISHKLTIASGTYMTTSTQAREEMFIMALSPKKKIGPLGKAKPWEHLEQIQQLQSKQRTLSKAALLEGGCSLVQGTEQRLWRWHHLPAVWPWGSHLSCLGLSILACEIGIIIYQQPYPMLLWRFTKISNILDEPPGSDIYSIHWETNNVKK